MAMITTKNRYGELTEIWSRGDYVDMLRSRTPDIPDDLADKLYYLYRGEIEGKNYYE